MYFVIHPSFMRSLNSCNQANSKFVQQTSIRFHSPRMIELVIEGNVSILHQVLENNLILFTLPEVSGNYKPGMNSAVRMYFLICVELLAIRIA